MKKLSKKSVLLFAAAMALCAFAMPSMAGAASWTAVNSEHTLDSPDVGFTSTVPGAGAVTSQCTSSSFTTTVNGTGTALSITAATFGGDCTAHGPIIGTCRTDATAQNLPWTGTALATNHVQIHGIHIRVTFTQTIPDATCNAPGNAITITGTLTGQWENARHELLLTNAEGLSSHGAAGTSPVTARGTFRDTAQTLDIS